MTREDPDTYSHSLSNSESLSESDNTKESHTISQDHLEDSEGDEPGEDLFDTNQLRRDYQPVPRLDHYDASLLDDHENGRSLGIGERRHVDRLLDLRDALNQEGTESYDGDPQGLHHHYIVAEKNDPADLEQDEIWRVIRERRERFRERTHHATGLPVRQIEEAKEELPYCQNQVSWTSRVGEILQVLFTGFFNTFRESTSHLANESNLTSSETNTDPSSQATYMERINIMVHEGSSSLAVSWDDLRTFCPKILDWIEFAPVHTLETLDTVATQIVQERFPDLYKYCRVFCRIRGYTAVGSLRALNTHQLNRFVSVRAVVVRRSNVLPKLRLVYFQCGRCSCSTNGPYEQKEGVKLKMKLICEDCQATGPFTVCREKTLYENYQHLTIQEPPSRVVPGHVPRQKQAIVLNELVDKARPGDEVVISGIFQTKCDARLNALSGFPTFATYLLVNNIERRRDMQLNELSEEDLQIIHRLSQNQHIREKIIDSIAPSLWGHRLIKTGLAYAMFGGVQRLTTGHHLIRGDINFLILGDPGMGKSQFLKYVEKTFDRTVYTTGKGASAVGLTAAVRKDPTTGEWCLEGGGLVLADEGLCLIDEFDKMSDQDRVSIHEAMEQQSISISKAGIVASLRARCAVIAVANPILEHYDSSLTFSENVDLSDPILSRFDILAVVKDSINPIQDEHLAEHVVTTHALCHPEADIREFSQTGTLMPGSSTPPSERETEEDFEHHIHVNAKWVTGPGRIPQSILKKYILYARRNCHPELRHHDEAKLIRFYTDLRQASISRGGIPITVRHLESIIRMACANAKIRLASTVGRSDMDFAISTMLESFIQSQKQAVATSLGRRFGRYRALANSPDEFLESVLIELLCRKGRDALRQKYHGRIPDTLDPEAVAIMDSVEVSLLEWTTVAKTLYSLPATVVTKFCETSRFMQHFIVKRQNDSSKPQVLITISRKPTSV